MDSESGTAPEQRRDPRRNAELSGVIRQAVGLLRDDRHLSEMSAYTMLVHAAANSNRTVRETAVHLVEQGRRASLTG